MSLETLRDNFHTQALEYRNIDLIIKSDNFAIAYSAASEIGKADIESVIYFDVNRKDSKRKIKEFITGQLKNLTPFHRMGIRKLREIGCNLSIDRYFNINKATLIEEIENVAARLKKNGM